MSVSQQSDTGMELRDLLEDEAFARRPVKERERYRDALALRRLARIFAEAPERVLQELVDAAVEFCGADSAGISLEERNVEGDEVWHGSHLHKWVNSKWWSGEEPTFITVAYAGRSLLIPEKWELYLKENYGNWRVPQVKYDASLQAPNRRVRHREKCRIHWRKLMIKYYSSADMILFKVAVDAYEKEFGRDDFVERLSRSVESQAAG